MNKSYEKVILSLGGSLLVPNGQIDSAFLKKFVSAISNEIKDKKKQFFIVVGGGGIARNYIGALKNLGVTESDTLDSMGIEATRMNALLVANSFGKLASPKIFDGESVHADATESVIVAGGLRPGFSTDMGAVLIAEKVGAESVINMSNVSYVYDSDPKDNPEALKYSKISWDEYLSKIPSVWEPGLNSPFDPIASRRAKDVGITVKIIGSDLDNLQRCFVGLSWEGTIIGARI